MKPAFLKGDAFLADVAQATASDPDALHIWWLGQSGFLCASGGKRVLFDPYLSDSLTRKYAGSGKEHTRMTELVIEPGKLTDINLVTSSHNHTDHLDGETLKAVFATNSEAAFIIPEANRAFVAERLGVDATWPIGLTEDQSKTVDAITISGLPAAHDNIDRDDRGNCKYMGFVTQWNGWSVYHSGDTRPINGLAERLAAFDLDVALLPINGTLEERKVSGNLWGQEAAALAHNADARTVVPCHYDMFTFNTETPAAFEEACQQRSQGYQVLQNGERLTFRR